MATPLPLRVLERNAVVYRRVWKGTAATSFLNPVLFLAAMGLGLGQLVDRGAGPATLEGVTYLAFLAPGLLAAQAMQTGAGDGSWPVLAGIKWVKFYHGALATPVGVRDLLAGHLGWVAIRLVLTSLAFAVVAVAFGAIAPLPALVGVLPAVLCGLAYAAPVTAFAATLEEGQGLTAFFRFGIVPMFLFSGTFFPVTQLPGFLQPAAYLVPLWHGVQLCRSVALQVAPAWPVVAHLGYLALWTAVGWALAQRQLTRRLLP